MKLEMEYTEENLYMLQQATTSFFWRWYSEAMQSKLEETKNRLAYGDLSNENEWLELRAYAKALKECIERPIREISSMQNAIKRKKSTG